VPIGIIKKLKGDEIGVSMFKLNTKLTVSFILSGLIPALIISLIISLIIFSKSAESLKISAYKILDSTKENKANQVEDYFDIIKNQILTFSKTHTVINGIEDFQEGFVKIERDLSITDEILQEYENEIAPYYERLTLRVEESISETYSFEDLKPKKKAAIILQKYSCEPSINGAKGFINHDLLMSSLYNDAHQKYHPVVKEYQQKFAYYDIFFFNNDGDMIYSVFKELDYGTNLIDGPYSKGNFGRVVQKALNVPYSNQDTYFLEDFEIYIPSYGDFASFISTPVYNTSKEQIGVLAFQMPIGKVNQIMSGVHDLTAEDIKGNWQDVGLGEEGQVFLLAKDKTLRNETRLKLEDAENNYQNFLKDFKDTKTRERLKTLGKCIGVQKVLNPEFDVVFDGEVFKGEIVDYRGITQLTQARKLDIPQLNWIIVAQDSSESALGKISNLLILLLVVFAVLSIIIFYAAYKNALAISKPVLDCAAVAKKLASGDYTGRVDLLTNDEVGELGNCINVAVQKVEETHQANLNIIQKFKSQDLALNSHCLVSITDPKGKLIFTNDKFCEISQYREEELLGKDHRILNSGYHPKAFMKNIWQTILSGAIWQGEVCNKAKDGSFYWVNATILAYKNAQGEITQLVAVRTDITQEKKHEKDLEAAFAEATKANEAKSQFLANMSHEIRTPLNSIIGYSDILVEDELSEEQRDMTSSIKNSSETLLSLVNDILDLAKVESGELVLEEIPVNLEDILFETGKSLVAKLKNKKVEINVQMNDSYALAYADPTRLKQVFINLMGNSIKFTDAGEVVAAVETISEDDTSMHLRFSVRDTGIGISQEQAEVIFEPFKQADGSTTRKYGGTGLGLNITKQIIAHMNSEIKVKSEVGAGSEFYFDIQLKKYFPESLEEKPDVSELSEAKILIVDDNETANAVFCSYLKKVKINYRSVFSAAEAIDILTTDKFDVIIMDLMMPEMDGYSLAKLVKEKYPESKLIAATADIRPGTIPKVKKHGFDSYLLKPVRAGILYKTLRSLHQKEESKLELLTTANADNSFVSAKLLVVDDNAMNLKLASKIFSKMGHTVDIADSGQQAISKIENEDYDIIFMDMQMPEMSGIEATEIIREKGNTTPIVALTANAFDSDRKACMAAGMNDFATKPLRRDELHRIISGFMKSTVPFCEKRILIVEDDQTTALLLSAIISQVYEGCMVKNAYTGMEAFTLLGSYCPHIIILDFMLPDMDGLKVLEFLKGNERFKDIKVVVNSSLEKTDPRILKMKEIGVAGILSKGDTRSQKQELLNCLKRSACKTTR
jgi:PAS domain S-box-containing protein